MVKQLSKSEQYLESAEAAFRMFAGNVEEPVQRNALVEASSYLQLAIQYSNGFLPRAYSRLSLAMCYLGDLRRANDFANTAISQMPYAFNARLTRLILAMDKLSKHDPYIDHSSMWGTLFSLGVAQVSVSNKRGEVSKEARNLAWAFFKEMEKDQEEGSKNYQDWVEMADTLLNIADLLKQNRIEEPEMYRAILVAPWDRVPIPVEWKQRTNAVRLKAEGLFHLARH